MERKKRKWWLLGIPVILVLGIVGFAFRDAIVIRAAPKAVLTSALNDLFSQLEQRFRNDPLLIVAGSLDPEGKYTVDMKLETEKDLLGPVCYDMTVQTDGNAHQLFAEGTASTSSKAVDLSLYLDTGFMAVSSEGLVGGTFYGITYDTFYADMHKIPFLNYMVSDSVMKKWDSSVREIQEKMSRTYALPSLPETSDGDARMALLGIAALPCKVQKCEIPLGDTVVSGYQLDFSVSGQQLEQLLTAISDTTEEAEGTAVVSFCLVEKSVVKITVQYASSETAFQYSLDLGRNPGENQLTLQGSRSRDGQYDELAIAVATQQGENRYAETWNIRKGSGEPVSVAFDWNPLSGDMTLKTSASAESCSLNLTEAENGFRLATDDLSRLMHSLSMDGESTQKDDKISCDMVVSKGSEIVTPEYKNLDQWSMDDFFVLLNGVGSLFGISIR
ncbi:MAG: hypothetical protein ACI4PC_05180 [Oscillospiraceae bacterium]